MLMLGNEHFHVVGVQTVGLFDGQLDDICQNLNCIPFNLSPLPVKIYPIEILAQVYKHKSY